MKKSLLQFFRHLNLALFLLITISSSAQFGYETHWHVGIQNGIDFSSGVPVNSSSSIETPASTEPAVLSDQAGNLLAYSDGLNVFNVDGDLVENGEFTSNATENIFAPIPGDPDRFYLFRSGAGSIGVTWTIIDLSANGGSGSIDEAEKNVNFHPYNSQLMVTSHANQTDFWLVIADNNNGSGGTLNINSFEITGTGFDNASSYTGEFIFAGWDPYVDDARMSPECTKIATIHKGHYSTIFEFDNSTGEVVTGYSNSANTNSSFVTQDFIEFSESGDFLYVLKDNDQIVRYNANALNEVDFEASTFSIDISGASTPDWSHIKRGPDGNMYLMNENENVLDMITDSEGSSPVLVENVLEFEGENAKYFPNTMNSCQGVTYIVVSDVCISDSTLYLASTNVDPDSVYWTINGNGITDTIYDLTSFNEYYNEPNELAITFNYLFDDLWYILEDSAFIYAQPVVELGEDIVACQGDVIELSAGENPYDLMWNTGSQDNNIIADFSGTYSVTIVNGACFVSDDIDVLFIQEPQTNIEDIVICDEQIDVVLDATGSWIDDYSWQDGSSDSTLTVSETGLYSVNVSNQCFEAADSAQVTYVFFPPSLIDDEFSLCGSIDSLFLESTYQEGNILWSNGDIGPTTTIIEDGSYTITINQLGCFAFDDFDVVQIDYVDVNNLLIPNVVTVNGDGMNDLFRPFAFYDKDENICTYETLFSEMQIFNRWGNELYTGGCSWDAQYEETDESNEGTFYYIIDASSACKQYTSAKKFTGTVQIIK